MQDKRVIIVTFDYPTVSFFAIPIFEETKFALIAVNEASRSTAHSFQDMASAMNEYLAHSERKSEFILDEIRHFSAKELVGYDPLMPLIDKPRLSRRRSKLNPAQNRIICKPAYCQPRKK